MKEKQFDKVCDEIVATMDNVCAAMNMCKEARARKPFIHFIATVGSLMTLAWFGNRISKYLFAISYSVIEAEFIIDIWSYGITNS